MFYCSHILSQYLLMAGYNQNTSDASSNNHSCGRFYCSNQPEDGAVARQLPNQSVRKFVHVNFFAGRMFSRYQNLYHNSPAEQCLPGLPSFFIILYFQKGGQNNTKYVSVKLKLMTHLTRKIPSYINKLKNKHIQLKRRFLKKK